MVSSRQASHEQAIDLFRYRLAGLLILRSSLNLLTAWAFLWGTIVLVLRTAVGVPLLPLLWGSAALPLAIGLAVFSAWRRLPGRTAIRALLDRCGNCGGLLVASAEVPMGRWEEHLPAPVRPQINWQGSRAMTLFALGAGFLALSFLVPQRLASLGGEPVLDVSREVERIHKQIDILKEEAIIDSARADSLSQKLEQVRDEASGKEPGKTLEALDHLERNVTLKEARSAAEAALRETEKLTRTETMADALNQAGEHMEPKSLTKAMETLAQEAEKAAKESESLERELDSMMRADNKDNKENKLDAKALPKLANACRDAKQQLARKLSRLKNNRMIDPDILRQYAKNSKNQSEKLAQRLSDCKGKCSLKDAEDECENGDEEGGPGLGRGGPGAKLTKGKGTSEEDVTFKDEALPPGALQSLQNSELQNLTKSPPKPEKGVTSQSGALTGAAAGGGSANTEIVLPRHRATVERYFERPTNSPR